MAVGLQAKFSRDYGQSYLPGKFRDEIRAFGWCKLDRKKIISSAADYWVFVLFGFGRKESDFVIITPRELLKRLDKIHGGKRQAIHSYLWVTKEGRWLGKCEKELIADNKFHHPARDFTAYLNDWTSIQKLNHG